MWLTDIIRARRWFVISLLVTLLVPCGVLAALSFFAKDMSEQESLEVAAVAVKNFIDENPPHQGWYATNIYVGDNKNIVIDIHVPRFEHAEIIRKRSERIKYSYLKLACPPGDAWVYEWLGGEDRIWINLHHHGTTLLFAPCPTNKSKGFLS